MASTFLATLHLLVPSAPILPATTFAEHALIAVHTNSSVLDDILADFAEVELWNVRPAAGTTHRAELFAGPDGLGKLRNVFASELSGSETIAGPGEMLNLWNEEHKRIAHRVATQPLTNASSPEAFLEFFEDYRPYDEIQVYMDRVLLEHIDIATHFELPGVTREGRTMRGISFSTATGGEDKPAMYIQGSAHANEWLGTMAAMYCIRQLVEGYETGDPQIVNILQSMTIYIVPVLNVDGYLWTFADGGARNWRKNRRDNGDGSFGVDLNRNNGPAATWCTAGSSTNPSSNTFCGPSVFSEPEDRAMSDFLERNTNTIVAAVDFHTFGSLLLYPYQVSAAQLPLPERDVFETLGLAQQEAINTVNGGSFRSIQGVDLYAHSGGFIDMSWELHRIFGFTYEGSGNSHVQPPDNILPSSREQWEGVLTVSEFVLQRGAEAAL